MFTPLQKISTSLPLNIGTDPQMAKQSKYILKCICPPAYLEEQKKLLRLPKIPYKHIIAPVMFWSDSTHLTSFETAHLWPIYMMFGFQLKLLRGQPNANLCHHLAYIPSVSCSKLTEYFVNIFSATGFNPRYHMVIQRRHCWFCPSSHPLQM